MAILQNLDRAVFLDTSFAIALGVPADHSHARAIELKQEIQRTSIKVISTHAICMEIGNSFAKQSFRKYGIAVMEALRNDPFVTILPVDDFFYEAGWKLFVNREDKEWGLVDCISFVFMNQLKLRQALTADIHFEQAGFQALLRT